MPHLFTAYDLRQNQNQHRGSSQHHRGGTDSNRLWKNWWTKYISSAYNPVPTQPPSSMDSSVIGDKDDGDAEAGLHPPPPPPSSGTAVPFERECDPLSPESRHQTTVLMVWAWVWISIFGLGIGVTDACYVTGAVSMIVAFVCMFLLLTYWRSGFLWVHGDWPRIVLAASLTVVVVCIITIMWGWGNTYHVHYTPSCHYLQH